MSHFFSTRNTNISSNIDEIKHKGSLSSSFLKPLSSRKSVNNGFNSENIYQDKENRNGHRSSRFSNYFPTMRGNRQNKSKTSRSVFGIFQRSSGYNESNILSGDLFDDNDNHSNLLYTTAGLRMNGNEKNSKAEVIVQNPTQRPKSCESSSHDSFHSHIRNNPEAESIAKHLIESCEKELTDIENKYRGPSCYSFKDNIYLGGKDQFVEVDETHDYISPTQFQMLTKIGGVSGMEYEMLLQQYTMMWEELNHIKSLKM